MTRSNTGMTVEERTAYWQGRVTEQERSAIPYSSFCKEWGITIACRRVTGAMLLSFIATCKRNAVELFAWFRDVL